MKGSQSSDALSTAHSGGADKNAYERDCLDNNAQEHKSSYNDLVVTYSTEAFPDTVVVKSAGKNRIALLVSLGQDYYESDKANAMLRHLAFLSSDYQATVDVVAADTLQVHNALDPWQFSGSFNQDDMYESLEACFSRKPLRDWLVEEVSDIDNVIVEPGRIYYKPDHDSDEIEYLVKFDSYSFLGGVSERTNETADEIYGSYQSFLSRMRLVNKDSLSDEEIKEYILSDVATKEGAEWFERNKVPESLGRKQWAHWPHDQQYKTARAKIDDLYSRDWVFRVYYLLKLSRYKTSKRSKASIPEYEYKCWKACHKALSEYFRETSIVSIQKMDEGLFYETISWKLRSIGSEQKEEKDVMNLIQSNDLLELPYFSYIKEYVLSETAILMLVWGTDYDYIMYHDQETELLFDYCRLVLEQEDQSVPIWLPVKCSTIPHKTIAGDDKFRQIFKNILDKEKAYVPPTIIDESGDSSYFYLTNPYPDDSTLLNGHFAVFYDENIQEWFIQYHKRAYISLFGQVADAPEEDAQLKEALKRGQLYDKDQQLLRALTAHIKTDEELADEGRSMESASGTHRPSYSDITEGQHIPLSKQELTQHSDILRLFVSGHLTKILFKGEVSSGVLQFVSNIYTQSEGSLFIVDPSKLSDTEQVIHYLKVIFNFGTVNQLKKDILLNEQISRGIVFFIPKYDSLKDSEKGKVLQLINDIDTDPRFKNKIRLIMYANTLDIKIEEKFSARFSVRGYTRTAQVLRVLGVQQDASDLDRLEERPLRMKLYKKLSKRPNMHFLLSSPVYIRLLLNDLASSYEHDGEIKDSDIFRCLIDRTIAEAFPYLCPEKDDIFINIKKNYAQLIRSKLDKIKEDKRQKALDGIFIKEINIASSVVVNLVRDEVIAIIVHLLQEYIEKDKTLLDPAKLADIEFSIPAEINKIVSLLPYFDMRNDTSAYIDPKYLAYFLACYIDQVHKLGEGFELILERIPFTENSAHVWLLFFEISVDLTDNKEISAFLLACLRSKSEEDLYSSVLIFLDLFEHISDITSYNVCLDGAVYTTLKKMILSNIDKSHFSQAVVNYVRRGFIHVFDWLVDANFDMGVVLTHDDYVATPLVFSLMADHADTTKKLIECKVDVNCPTSFKSPSAKTDAVTPLMIAARLGLLDSVRFLLDQKANPCLQNSDAKNALHLAAVGGYSATCLALLPDIASTTYVNTKDNGGFTALHFAAQNGLISTVARLLELKADPRISDYDGVLPLMLAIKNSHSALLDTLYFDSNSTDCHPILDNDDNSLLHYAAMQERSTNNVDVFEWCLSKCDVLIPFGDEAYTLNFYPFNLNSLKMTPILIAIGNDNIQGFKYLFSLDFLSPKNAVAADEVSTLMYFTRACYLSAIKIVEYLIDHVHIPSPTARLVEGPDKGKNALSFAAASSNCEVFQYLLHHSMLSWSDEDLWSGKTSAIALAFGNHNLGVVRILINHACYKQSQGRVLRGLKRSLETLSYSHNDPTQHESAFIILYTMGDLGVLQRIFSLFCSNKERLEICQKRDPQSGDTLLMMAARRGHFMLVRYTIDVFKKALDVSTAPPAESRQFKKSMNRRTLSTSDKRKVNSIWRRNQLNNFFDQKNNDDKTASKLAAVGGYRSIVSLLLDEVRAANDEENISEDSMMKP